MQLTITDRCGVLGEAERDFVQRHVLFALSRFDTRLRRVQVVISDENGPRGNVDRTCRITARLRRLGDVEVSEIDRDVEACVRRATERIGRAVQRQVEKQRFTRRSGSISYEGS
jgi:hypothetical protein